MADTESGRDRLEELASEFLARLRAGETPSIADYAAENPNLASQIRELFPMVRAAEQVKEPRNDWLSDDGAAKGDGSGPVDVTVQSSGVYPRGAVVGGADVVGPHQGMALGKYVLEECIGRGSLGSVWRSEHPEFGIPVAVKILHASAMSGTEQEEQRFLREARSAALLNHPHVIRVFDAGVVQGLKYLVMEYLPSGTVAGLQDELGGTLPVLRAVEIVAATVDAVGAAAKLGIVHRDIKPENILLDEHGQPKLADLGLAKFVQDSEQTSVTRTGQVMGTPFYIAPEQAMGSRDVDVRTDIYSLGATLYHLVTGKPPFDGPTVYEVFHGHMSKPLVEPRLANPQIPGDLSKIICRMLEKRPDDRYQTTTDLRADLDQFLARDGGPPVPASLTVRTKRATYAAAAVAGLVLFGAGIWLVAGRDRGTEGGGQPVAAVEGSPSVAGGRTEVALPPPVVASPDIDEAPPTVASTSAERPETVPAATLVDGNAVDDALDPATLQGLLDGGSDTRPATLAGARSAATMLAENWQAMEGFAAAGERPTPVTRDQYSLFNGVVGFRGGTGKGRTFVYGSTPVLARFHLRMEVKDLNVFGIIPPPGQERSSCQITLFDRAVAAAGGGWHTVVVSRETDRVVCTVDNAAPFSMKGSHLAHGRVWLYVPSGGTGLVRRFDLTAESAAPGVGAPLRRPLPRRRP